MWLKKSSNFMMQVGHTGPLARLGFKKGGYKLPSVLPSNLILVDLAEAFSNIKITAYADRGNVIISGSLKYIQYVIGEFQRETFRAGVRLNTAEHIPSWIAQPDDLLSSLQKGPIKTSAQGI
jgi:hypothetical protein